MNDFLGFIYRHFPHRWLNQKAEGTKRLFEGLGNSIDDTAKYVALLQRNSAASTAEELITELENEYGLTVNPSYSIDFRRERILARMRIQDSPVTMQDLTKMLEALGLHNCSFKNDYSNSKMEVQFDSQEEQRQEIREAMQLLDENIRAHIEFFMRAIVNGSVRNNCLVALYRMTINAHIKNLGLEYYFLNGQKLLDGSWVLQSCARTLRINKLLMKSYIRNLDSYPVMLDGEKMLDGSWKLDVKGKKYFANLKMMFQKRNRLDSFQEGRFLFSTGIENLSLDYVQLDGRKRLDGSWYLDSIMKGVQSHLLKMGARQRNMQKANMGKARYFSRQRNGNSSSAFAGLDFYYGVQHLYKEQARMQAQAGKKNEIGRYTLRNQYGITGAKQEIQSEVKLDLSAAARNAQGQETGLAVAANIREEQAAGGGDSYLTLDTIWRMGGTELLDGGRKLNAAIVKVTL